MLIWKVAIRNIFRQKRRTILTMLTMFGSFTLAAISIAWSDGTYNDIIDLFTRNRLGHIQIHRTGYLDRPQLYNTIDNYHDIHQILSTLSGIEAWTYGSITGKILQAGKHSVMLVPSL